MDGLTIIGGLAFLSCQSMGMDNFDGRRAYDHTNQSIRYAYLSKVCIWKVTAHISRGDAFHTGQSYRYKAW